MWRVATHDKNRASLNEIQERWSMTDLVNAHLALDVHDELAFQASRAAREKR